ncbi:AAA ATPase [Thermaerobacter marianensis DSM 12885]|uniref:AAA ATPase n=1 Tax=Thermaerobacter marianensis (strain ATCC 700841 / DSM 12885 / JCM 10246 / 7p75a) TaxID=644966 RepID=E6SLR0_THEM7|nr:hypothetical protein [Thermaerobacter marianensis]ADU51359.1 AAA ATPase [Thermaerobacter marianensis DSM 12885]
MQDYTALIRHEGNRQLFEAVEMSIIAQLWGEPLHLHAEGVRGTGKTTILRAARRILPRIERIRGCPYNCDPRGPHCPLHAHWTPAQIAAHGTEWIPMPFREISPSAKVGTVTGSLDLARLTDVGRPEAALLPGTLAQAHRGIVLVDEINRVADVAPELADCLLDVMGTKPGRLQIEETGLPPVELTVRVAVWAASNPDEEPGPLEEIRRQLSDRFDLVLDVRRPGEPWLVKRILALGEARARAAAEAAQAALAGWAALRGRDGAVQGGPGGPAGAVQDAPAIQQGPAHGGPAGQRAPADESGPRTGTGEEPARAEGGAGTGAPGAPVAEAGGRGRAAAAGLAPSTAPAVEEGPALGPGPGAAKDREAADGGAPQRESGEGVGAAGGNPDAAWDAVAAGMRVRLPEPVAEQGTGSEGSSSAAGNGQVAAPARPPAAGVGADGGAPVAAGSPAPAGPGTPAGTAEAFRTLATPRPGEDPWSRRWREAAGRRPEFPEPLLDVLAEIYVQFRLESLRALEAWRNAAALYAARAGRRQVRREDLLEVAPAVLRHRVEAGVLSEILEFLARDEATRAEDQRGRDLNGSGGRDGTAPWDAGRGTVWPAVPGGGGMAGAAGGPGDGPADVPGGQAPGLPGELPRQRGAGADAAARAATADTGAGGVWSRLREMLARAAGPADPGGTRGGASPAAGGAPASGRGAGLHDRAGLHAGAATPAGGGAGVAPGGSLAALGAGGAGGPGATGPGACHPGSAAGAGPVRPGAREGTTPPHRARPLLELTRDRAIRSWFHP